jgi:hypothetical protein
VKSGVYKPNIANLQDIIVDSEDILKQRLSQSNSNIFSAFIPEDKLNLQAKL